MADEIDARYFIDNEARDDEDNEIEEEDEYKEEVSFLTDSIYDEEEEWILRRRLDSLRDLTNYF